MIKIITAFFPNLKISKKQEEQLKIYYEYLIEQNEIMNLTTIIEEEEVYSKHFLDSLILLKEYSFTNNLMIADVGSGAGFPGIVLKIFCPEIKLTIIEALEKRCLFLKRLITKLELNEIEIIHTRAEEYSWLQPERFDVILSRAVANLTMLLELVVRMVKVNGLIICYKGPTIDKELSEAQTALNILKLELVKIQYENISNIGERNICYFKKITSTPKKFPRSFNQIKKLPIR